LSNELQPDIKWLQQPDNKNAANYQSVALSPESNQLMAVGEKTFPDGQIGSTVVTIVGGDISPTLTTHDFPNMKPFTSVAEDPREANSWLVSNSEGVWRSDDNGANWSRLELPGAPAGETYSKVKTWDDPEGQAGMIIAYVNTSPFIYYLQDDGTWARTPVYNGPLDGAVTRSHLYSSGLKNSGGWVADYCDELYHCSGNYYNPSEETIKIPVGDRICYTISSGVYGKWWAYIYQKTAIGSSSVEGYGGIASPQFTVTPNMTFDKWDYASFNIDANDNWLIVPYSASSGPIPCSCYNCPSNPDEQ
ncbi:MAG: hypothetical protein ACRC5A_05190, partial [Enterobacteriaceae bacterium]